MDYFNASRIGNYVHHLYQHSVRFPHRVHTGVGVFVNLMQRCPKPLPDKREDAPHFFVLSRSGAYGSKSMNMKKEMYLAPKAKEMTMYYESSILSGNTEKPDDPGQEIDI